MPPRGYLSKRVVFFYRHRTGMAGGKALVIPEAYKTR